LASSEFSSVAPGCQGSPIRDEVRLRGEIAEFRRELRQVEAG
jgi:hypothetical protein